ncbi:MAG TPA: VCBS repeat-containing protein [Herpetosiphonaceae bacterium]|nr:VCBS repeat-containing protein [Herpetosiphonaceae bacterium]
MSTQPFSYPRSGGGNATNLYYRFAMVAILVLLGGNLWIAPGSAQASALPQREPTESLQPSGAPDAKGGNAPEQLDTESFVLGWKPANERTILDAQWGDVNADGYLDLLVTNRETIELYQNNNGLLSEKPIWSLAQDKLYPNKVTFIDINNDEYMDMVLTNEQHVHFFKNRNGSFDFIPNQIINGISPGVDWIDIDNDGYIDLSVTIGGENRLYRNDFGTFFNMTTWNIAYGGKWGDINKDGFLDFVKCADRLYLHINQQGKLSSTATWMSMPFAGPEEDLISCGNFDIIDIDGNGWLDVYVFIHEYDFRSYTATPALFRNTSGVLSQDQSIRSWEHYSTMLYQWGDIDGDNDPDLVIGGGFYYGYSFIGCDHTKTTVYRNDSGSLTSAWTSDDKSYGYPLLKDLDSDGDLDLTATTKAICGNEIAFSKIYRNSGNFFEQNPVWSSVVQDENILKWADIKNDGRLGFVSSVGVYYNHRGLAFQNQSIETTGETMLADINNDSFLDLFAGSSAYINTSGTFSQTPVWSSAQPMAFGDIDQDNDLDLLSGGTSLRIYRNTGGTFTTSPIWSVAKASTHAAFGDVDQDGDLDLINAGDSLDLYRNNNGVFTQTPTWSIATKSRYAAFGDVDQDSDLDLMVATAPAQSSTANALYLYRNDNGVLSQSPAWTMAEESTSVAWGDIDQDGDLDLVSGGSVLHLYENTSGVLSSSPAWSPLDYPWTWTATLLSAAVAWIDVDNDGDLDLSAGIRLYINANGVLSSTGIAIGKQTHFEESDAQTWGDLDQDGDLDFVYRLRGINIDTGDRGTVVGRSTRASFAQAQSIPSVVIQQSPPATPYYGTAAIWTARTRTFSYALRHPSSQKVQRVLGQYSLDGGGHWYSALAAAGTTTTNLATSPAGTVHTFTWDVQGSGVLGQSDNVVFRLIAVPSAKSPPQNRLNPYHYGSASSMTRPFRLRGNQIRVLQGTTPVVGAMVYHQGAAQGGQLQAFADSTGLEYRTTIQGYLQGRGQLPVGERLVALMPAAQTAQFSRYSTSAAPTPSGLAAFSVAGPGIQTLTVSANYPLMLFNVDVSLEWDARRDPQYIQQLKDDFARVSEVLYDWSNGQIALGAIKIYHARDHWNDAHVRIYATNRLRPNATQGGIITEPISDPLKLDLAYTPGQIHMGAVWNRYGDATSGVSDDWARTLAHEFGHYALFLDDNYLGLDSQGQLIAVESCPGAMSDPYRQDWYSEFHPDTGWLPACAQTLSQQETGRSDWSTITAFYPWLKKPSSDIQQTNSGPSQLPLAVTHVRFVEPDSSSAALDTPIFFTVNKDGSRYLNGGNARAVLFQANRLIDLGQPALDQITARGARIGDRLCLYDAAAGRTGCETIQAQDEHLTINAPAQWQPEVVVSPVTSTTLKIRVSNIPSGLALRARVFPSDSATSTVQALSPVAGGYERSIILDEPTAEGHVQVWVDEPDPRRETVAHYSVGGNPGYRRVRVGYRRVRVAPILSPDGQALLFGGDLNLKEGEVYILQAATTLPEVLSWATPVGNGYWLSSSPDAPALPDTSISISYLGTDVPAGEEQWIRMYFWNGAEWRKLETTLDTYNNAAVAKAQGPGLYLLMSSVEVPIPHQGWNLISYPVAATRPVTEALQSIDGSYSIVYSFDSTATDNPWSVYDPLAPAWISDLTSLEFGKGYWIHATQPGILYLKGSSSLAKGTETTFIASGLFPPAIYYGEIGRTSTFTPTAGLDVRAMINGQLCGQTQTQWRDGAIIYILKVDAQDPQSARCGTNGTPVIITIDDSPIATTVLWDNRHVWHRPLGNTSRVLYIPMLQR